MALDTHVTPGRHTRLILDIQSPVATRPPWMEFRRGAEIRPAQTEAVASRDVILQASGVWTLAPHREDFTRFIDTGWGGAIKGVEVNMAPHWGTIDTFRRPDELPGIGASGTVIPSGVPAFWRRTSAGASWNQELTADVAALPKPVQYSQDFPMDRVVSGKITDPANQAYALIIGEIPGSGPAPDTICTFYFGGASEATLTGGAGAAARAAREGSPALHGSWAVTVRGNGALTLYERTINEWVPRVAAPPSVPLLPKTPNILAITPTDTRHITIKSPAVHAAPPVVLPPSHPVLLRTERPRPAGIVYRNNPRVTGYTPTEAITGPGTPRLDVRRGLRVPITMWRLRLPPDGILVDLPWWCPYPIPAGTTLTLRVDAHIPRDCSLSAEIYDASTDNPLVKTGNNQFLTATSSQAYYVAFTFEADPARVRSPALFGYAIDVPGAVASLAPVSITGGNIRSVSTTGPDLDGQSDTANLQIQDVKNELPLLRGRARIPARVAVLNDAAVLTSILHEGEVSLASGTKRGKPGRAYPSPDWYQYDVTMVGMWVRLAEQINLDRHDFGKDPNAPPLANGRQPSAKVTDVIRFLLHRVGFPDSQIDVPDLSIRLWADAESGEAGMNPEDYILEPGVAAGEYIHTLCQKYLNRSLIWCPNSGAAGMWRLLPIVTAETPAIAAFVGGPPSGAHLPVHPGSYPAQTAPILHDSFRVEPKPPEGNFVVVYGADTVVGSKYASSMYNPVSADFTGPTSDPLHIDYLGRIVPILIVDTGLQSKNATAYICKQVFNFACHGQIWLKWRAPLLLVVDPADLLQTNARPLRLNDVVTVYGQRAVIHSYNINYNRDGVQLCDYEALAA